MATPPISDILFLDIETVSGTKRFDELNERMQAQWLRKAKYQKNELELDDQDLYFDRAGIFAEFGKIVTVAVGFVTTDAEGNKSLRVKDYTDHNELNLLQGVADLLENKLNPAKTYLCGHNVKEFDIPYLCRRMLVNGVKLPKVLNIAGKKPWEVAILDTLELWKFGDYKNYTSLELLATLFGLETSKEDIDGSQVNGVYYGEEDGLDRIAKYCKLDVVVTTNLFLKLTQQEIIAKEKVIMV